MFVWSSGPPVLSSTKLEVKSKLPSRNYDLGVDVRAVYKSKTCYYINSDGT